MSYDLTLTSPVFNASGKYGSSLTTALNTGYGMANDVNLGLTSFTIEAWVKTTLSTGSGIRLAAGSGASGAWIGFEGGKARGVVGNVTILSTALINDGQWHHLAICVTPASGGTGSGTFWLDGVLVGSTAAASNTTPTAGTFGIGRFGTVNTYDWIGDIDEVAVSSGIKYTAAFTPGPVSNSQSGLRAVYHLDGDGVNSAGLAAGDITAPVLTGPTGTQTGSTTATGGVTTDEGNGTLYCLPSTTSTATVAAVKASAFSQAVTTTGAKSFSLTGLTAAAMYYLHFVQTDSSGNNSGIVTSASFTTAAASDTTGPVLSSPTVSSITSTTATGSVTTDEGNGTLYGLVSANPTETVATIRAAAITAAVTSTGVKSLNFSGLAPSTQYYAHFVHRDTASNDSNVVNSAAFTTAAAAASDTTAPTLSAASGVQTGSTTATGSATTNEGNGTLYFLFTTASTATAAQVKAGASQVVTATGAQAVAATGLTAATAYYVHFLHRDAAGNDSAVVSSASFTTAAAASTGLDTSKILFSPYNWDIQAGSAKTINSGAYFRVNFSGASCVLNFDMTGVLPTIPKLSYRVDGFGPWITVDLAATIPITIANVYPWHHLEIHVRSTSQAVSRWVSQAVAVKLTGITLAAGGLYAKPIEKPLYGLYYGDSITEASSSVAFNNDAVPGSDAGQSWATVSAELFGAEFGIVAFGRQGFTSNGNPDVPFFQNTWNLMYQGVSRSFARAPDYIVINMATNDGSGIFKPAAITVLNGLIAATPASTKIIVLRTFNGLNAPDVYWKAAIAESSAPARITYVDTTGWFITTDSFDGVHPNGFAHVSRIAPLMAAKLREVLGTVTVNPTPVPATGTSTFTTEAMISSGTLRANQSCQWTWFAGGSIGSTAGDPVHGAGTLNAQAKLVATGLPAGSGYIMARFSDGGRYYQEGTAA